MQANQKFVSRILAVNAKGEAVNNTLIDLGTMAVKKAFANDDKSYAEALVQTLIPAYRTPMVSWLRRYGMDITALDKEHKGQYIVAGVRNKKDQDRIFKMFDAAKHGEGKLNDVIQIVDRAPTAKKETVLKGTPEERAKARMTKVIEAMKDKDPVAAGVLNMMWAAKTADLHNAFYDNSGNRIELSAEEHNAVMGTIVAMRAQALTLKAA